MTIVARNHRARLFVVVIGVLASACSTTATRPPSPPAPVPTAVVDTAPASLRWTRNSAEHRALFLQVYRNATDQLELRAPRLAGTLWAVVLDADETTLDNSADEQDRARRGEPYSSAAWARWVNRMEATALPGAVAFTNRVRALGGRVVIVTNRADSLCAPTRENLRRVGFTVDLVLCAPPTGSDKNPRFRAVEAGTAAPGVPALRIAMWLGDNIEDFPSLKQDVRTGDEARLSEFGRSWFVLPNPMYGSWAR